MTVQSDSDGQIDYNRFVRYIARGAENGEGAGDFVKSRAKTSIQATNSSNSQSLVPHEDFINSSSSEAQTNALKDSRAALHEIFIRFDHNEIDSDEFIEEIEELGIITTRALTRTLTKSSAADVSFGQVLKALSTLDAPTDGNLDGVGAGGTKEDNIHEATFGQAGLSRRRFDPYKNSSTFGRSDDTVKSGKAIERIRTSNSMRSGEMVSILANGPKVKTVSNMKQDMAAGIAKEGTSGLSSDQKVLRQQIYAAIRRMDRGELSASQFKERMMQIGIEIPPDIIKMLMDHNSSGSATFNTFAAAFERLLEEREAEGINSMSSVESIVPQLSEDLRSRNQLLILQRLAQAFKNKDILGVGKLSLVDFKNVMTDFFPGMSDDNIMTVFNGFDEEGSGNTNYHSILHTMQGDMNDRRHYAVQQTFLSLPKNTNGDVPAESIQASFHAADHPDTVDGVKTQGQVITEFLDTFEVDNDDASVSQDSFVSYYANISAMCERDDHFIRLLKASWGLTDKNPAPVNYRKSASGKVVKAPSAAQTHGNILNWKHASGELEDKVAVYKATKSINPEKRSGTLNVTAWADPSEDPDGQDGSMFGAKRGGGKEARSTQFKFRGELSDGGFSWDTRQKKKGEKVEVERTQVRSGRMKRTCAPMQNGVHGSSSRTLLARSRFA